MNVVGGHPSSALARPGNRYSRRAVALDDRGKARHDEIGTGSRKARPGAQERAHAAVAQHRQHARRPLSGACRRRARNDGHVVAGAEERRRQTLGVFTDPARNRRI